MTKEAKARILIKDLLGKGCVKRRKSISFEKFASLYVPIPPLTVQRSIARKSSQLDGLRHRAERLAQTIDRQIHRVLKAAGLDHGRRK